MGKYKDVEVLCGGTVAELAAALSHFEYTARRLYPDHRAVLSGLNGIESDAVKFKTTLLTNHGNGSLVARQTPKGVMLTVTGRESSSGFWRFWEIVEGELRRQGFLNGRKPGQRERKPRAGTVGVAQNNSEGGAQTGQAGQVEDAEEPVKLPKRDGDLAKWKEVWKQHGRYHRNKSLGRIQANLKRTNSQEGTKLPTGEKTLRKIFRAGENGQLD